MSTIETDRLILRRFRPADDGPMAEMLVDTETMRYFPMPPLNLEAARARAGETREMFEQHWNRRGHGVWAIADKSDGRLLGRCGLRYLPEFDDVEVLYLLHRSRWGQGLVTEAARASLDFGFRQAGLRRIIAITDPENRGSRRVMEKIGMSYERHASYRDVTVVLYGIER